jgi:hypothetical protein
MRIGCLQMFYVLNYSVSVCHRMRTRFERIQLCKRSTCTETDPNNASGSLYLRIWFGRCVSSGLTCWFELGE